MAETGVAGCSGAAAAVLTVLGATMVSCGADSLHVAPAPFARQSLTSDMLTTRTPEAHDWAVRRFKEYRSEGQFVPPGVDRPTVVFPGYDGGAGWGGSAVDPRGTATPATYMIDGKQYVVICTSNARDRAARQGSAYVAFALP